MLYSTLIAAATVATGALAAPEPAVASGASAGMSFTVPRVVNTAAAPQSGLAAKTKAFAKFKMDWPNAPAKAKKKRSPTQVKPVKRFTPGLTRREASKAKQQLASLGLDAASESSVMALLTELLGDVKAQGSACSTGTAAAPSATSTTAAGAGTGAGTGTATNGTGAATGTSNTGGATAAPKEGGALYLTPVNIGGQTLNLDFDTGSSDLWVFDMAATGKGFNTATATGFTPMAGATFNISYGDGSNAAGSVGTDTVSIGSATVSNQAVELATSISAEFQQEQATDGTDGLLGLAFSSLNTVTPTKQNTFYANIMPSLATPVFTANLLLDGSGTFEFGNIDQTKFTGTLAYTPVDSSQGFWQFPSASYKVAGTAGTNTAASPAIADTGTSLLLVDANVATAYYAKVTGAQNSATEGGYIFPCSAALPSFSVALGTTGNFINVPGSALSFGPIEAGSTTCFGGIQSNENNPIQIYGDILLKTQFVVFDGKTPQIGFAPSAGSSNTTTAAAARKY